MQIPRTAAAWRVCGSPRHRNPIGGDVGFSKAGPDPFCVKLVLGKAGLELPRVPGLDSQERDKCCTTTSGSRPYIKFTSRDSFLIFTVKKLKLNKQRKNNRRFLEVTESSRYSPE